MLDTQVELLKDQATLQEVVPVMDKVDHHILETMEHQAHPESQDLEPDTTIKNESDK